MRVSTALLCAWALFQGQAHALSVASYVRPFRPPLSALNTLKSDGNKVHKAVVEQTRDLISQCTEHYRTVELDHFSWSLPDKGVTTFEQRYFVCDRHWSSTNGLPGPIFFYVGNEADVTLYLNNTGLMWESAAEFGALLVFAEHRYYGKSKPYRKHLKEHMQYLTSEQAMADYAELITHLKAHLKAEASPVIGFGGSYGGMLGTWFRYKYPHIIDGVVAGSAPIWTFEGEEPEFDRLFFSKIVTRDASPYAGAAEQCVPNIRQSWKVLFEKGKTAHGRKDIKQWGRLCERTDLKTNEDVMAYAQWLQSAFDFIAMGNYPYESAYILNGAGSLPKFPMRVACEYMNAIDPSKQELITGLAQAAGVFYNYTGDVTCFDFSQGANPETDEDELFWGYQYCTEQFMPMERDGVEDMFWAQPFNETAAFEACQEQWGVTPRPYWATIEWGGRNLDGLSNVIFSNGDYDPWSGGGVLKSLSDSVIAVPVDQGAHHLDLMFSNPEDTGSVKTARAIERAYMHKWVEKAYLRLDHRSSQKHSEQ